VLFTDFKKLNICREVPCGDRLDTRAAPLNLVPESNGKVARDA
jgi:hypothetical protein